MASDTFYISTPIYYVNDKPHIGHAYTTILADVLARYHRLLGDDTFFLTGTDEHGQKVQQAADKAGCTAQEQADATVVRFQELWDRLEITNDDFIRTTEPRHKEVVQDILRDLYERGEIYKAEYDGWYDVTSETFLTENDLKEGPPPEERPGVERVTETNYFFKMSQYRDWLVQYINDNPEFIQPDFRRNETLGFLRQELGDLCISRPKSRLAWGIELPFDEDFVTYVWFDALVNYISGIGYLRDDERFRHWWPVNCHLIGKDILTTHTVYWPTMLKAMGVPMPKTVFAHGWWLMKADDSGEDEKMSKSKGNVVNPMDMIEQYGADAFRYYLIAEMTLGQDAGFSVKQFVTRFNADLANDFGNLLSRVLNLMKKNCDGQIPEVSATELENPEEKELWAIVQGAVSFMSECIGTMRLDKGLAEVMTAIRATNRYLERKKPWLQAKEEDKGPLATTLVTAAEVLRIAAGLLFPVMPGKMAELRQTLGLDGAPPDLEGLKEWGGLKPGTPIDTVPPLFPKIQLEEPKPEAPDKTEGVVSAEDLIEYDDFAKVKLKTAVIESAERVEGADKLLKVQIKVGDESRQIVAGIAKHYEPDDLPGKTVVLVSNLKPAVIRGVQSQGMLLAASKGKKLRLVTVDGDLPPGAKVS